MGLSDTVEEVVAKFLGASEVDWEQLKPIVCFVVLWNRLEHQHKGQIRLRLLGEIASRLAAGGLQGRRYLPHIEFFRERYRESPEKLDRLFRRDHGGERRNEEMLRKFLNGDELSAEETLQAIIMIPYRIRNNLFHGGKSTYELYGQSRLFQHVNEILCLLYSDIQDANRSQRV